MSKAVAYYRASTPKQKHSINVQKEIVREYCSNNNIELIFEFEEIASGKEKTQIELKNVLQLAKENSCAIISTTVDRLTRDYSFGKNIIENYNTIFCCSPNMSLESKLELLSFAEKERQFISQRTKNILSSLKKNGVKLGNPNAHFTKEMQMMAYKKLSENAENNINNKKASSMIKAMLYKTTNLSEIARELNKNGFVTSRGKQFNSKQVKRIIEKYKLKVIKTK